MSVAESQWSSQKECAGENQFLEHRTMTVRHVPSGLSGRALVSLFDGGQANAMHTATEWLTTPMSYLSNYAHYLFDPSSRVVRLPHLLREDMGLDHVGVIILDELDFPSSPSADEIAQMLQGLMLAFAVDYHLLLIPNLALTVSRFGVSPTEAMEALSRVGIMPLDGTAFVAFTEDLEIFL